MATSADPLCRPTALLVRMLDKHIKRTWQSPAMPDSDMTATLPADVVVYCILPYLHNDLVPGNCEPSHRREGLRDVVSVVSEMRDERRGVTDK